MDIVAKAKQWHPEQFARVRSACRTAADGFDLDLHAAMICMDAARAKRENRTAYADKAREKARGVA